MPYKNIDPTIWGPHLWKFMHYYTLSYPEEPTEEDKDNLYNFFNTIQTVLPCEKCRYNFKSNLEKTPLTEEVLSKNINVVKWLFDIHNEVNKSTNKPVLLYEDFINIYSTQSTQSRQIQNTPDAKDKDIKIDKDKEIDKENNFTSILKKIIEYGKNNKMNIVLIIIIIIILMVYINKNY